MVDAAEDGTARPPGTPIGRRGFLKSAGLAAVPALLPAAEAAAAQPAPQPAAQPVPSVPSVPPWDLPAAVPDPSDLPVPAVDGDAVARLLGAPGPRDVRWLRRALQVAVALELATIPPYLCAWWSIKDRTSEPARLIQGIVADEMFHMGLTCNLLTAVGGRPRIASSVLGYPGPLPGGVRPDLTVYLSGLTKAYVRNVLMAIEAPEQPLVRESGPTIGTFYTALQDAFHEVRPALDTSGQLSVRIGPDVLRPAATLADVDEALEVIKEQGEGTSASPDVPAGHGAPAHYYAFGEIFHERRVVSSTDRWGYDGDPVPFPEARPMGVVPAGGWPDPPAAAGQLLGRFDLLFSRVVHALEGAWAIGDAHALDGAVRSMRSLEEPALALMDVPLPDGSGVYGPQFHVLTRRPDDLS
ncbi:ferritin-like domain-containing protein [Streptomyces sp. NRRL B-24484]|uniref:ferritin-like domain-containing protein n=1 Tax=Streptomyces sp. NRRL B-24484 TaxID=1463833 RepID=UPI000B1F52AC|nr:ferritin-like protein [Streptomyces sp. NRRL B-24484]